MGVMTKMREKTGAVIGVLVFAFGGLWVLQDSGAFDAIGQGQSRTVARVNGDTVDYELYQQAVEQRVQLYQQQGIEITPAVQAQIENEVFDALVDNALREREMERLGVQVSDAEVVELITGENPHPFIRQIFADGRGGVDRTALNEAINNRELAPQLRALEEQIRQSRRQEKLDALIQATARVSELEVREEFARRNRRAGAQVVALRYADVPDADVQVSDAELQRFYRDNRSRFERPRTYVAEFVSFPKIPSARDSALARDELTRLRAGFAAAEDPGRFASDNSFGETITPAFTPAAELPPALATAVYADPTPGRVVGPLAAGDRVFLTRITGVRTTESPVANARHILFPTDQRAAAEQTLARLRAGELDFATAARGLSQDPGSAQRGGDLGWFGRGQMVAPFEAAVFGAAPGQLVGPVETQFGWHVIQVVARTNQEAELVSISRPLAGSFAEVRERADEFQFFTTEEGRSFREAAQAQNLEVTQIQVQADQNFIPGLQVGREVFRFFERSRRGAISEPFDAGDRFVVMHLIETQPAGVRPFEDVRGEVEAEVLTQKKRERQAQRLREALSQAGGNLEALARAVGTTVQTVDNLTLASPMTTGFGREPRLVGTAFGLPQGRTSGVVEGENAAFVVRTTLLEGATAEQMTAEQRESIRSQLLQRKRQQVLQQWQRALRENAEVEDFRTRFL